ncbi:MAG TPA: hypothetical protein DIW52_23875 [Pseudomonas sp.]|nr:hypothetical protein [Pseudomonas sp.]
MILLLTGRRWGCLSHEYWPTAKSVEFSRCVRDRHGDNAHAHGTGGHTPGHSVVYVTSDGERLTFAGDALFPVAFERGDARHELHYDQRRHRDFLQGLGSERRDAHRVSPRLAIERGRLGQPDDVFLAQRLSGDRA